MSGTNTMDRVHGVMELVELTTMMVIDTCRFTFNENLKTLSGINYQNKCKLY